MQNPLYLVRRSLANYYSTTVVHFQKNAKDRKNVCGRIQRGSKVTSLCAQSSNWENSQEGANGFQKGWMSTLLLTSVGVHEPGFALKTGGELLPKFTNFTVNHIHTLNVKTRKNGTGWMEPQFCKLLLTAYKAHNNDINISQQKCA